MQSGANLSLGHLWRRPPGIDHPWLPPISWQIRSNSVRETLTKLRRSSKLLTSCSRTMSRLRETSGRSNLLKIGGEVVLEMDYMLDVPFLELS